MTRPVGWLDLDAVSRCLVGLPPCDQITIADTILRQADAADRYRKRTGRRHVEFGDGSLAAAAQRFAQAGVSGRLDRSHLQALAVVLARMEARRAH